MIRDPETFQSLLDMIRLFVRERLMPVERQVEEINSIPTDVIDDMRAMGLLSSVTPLRHFVLACKHMGI